MKKDIAREVQALRELVENDEDLRGLSRWEEKINIFKIIENGKTEIRHSKVLAWLMTAKENHGIGDYFIREFIKSAIKNNPEKAYDIMDWAFVDYSVQDVVTEQRTDDGFVDITICFESLPSRHIVAIENKTGSNEHTTGKTKKKQTEEYRETIEKNYPDHEKLFVYLTPGNAQPADAEYWCVLSYEDVLAIIEKILSWEDLAPAVRLILTNYCSLIKTDVIGRDGDIFRACNAVYEKHRKAMQVLFDYIKNNRFKHRNPELLEKCTQVYALYKKELNLIYENRADERGELANKLYELVNGSDEFVLNAEAGRTYINFSSKQIDALIPKLPQPNGSWGSANNYQFWIFTGNYKEESLEIAFELGGKNLTKDIKDKHDRLISKLRPNDKSPEYTYKKIKTQIVELPNLREDTIEKAFAEAIQYAEEWVAEICEVLK